MGHKKLAHIKTYIFYKNFADKHPRLSAFFESFLIISPICVVIGLIMLFADNDLWFSFLVCGILLFLVLVCIWVVFALLFLKSEGRTQHLIIENGEEKMRSNIKIKSGEKTDIQASGMGRLIKSDGTIIEGRFHHGLANGECFVLYPDGSSYSGQMVRGRRCGSGSFICHSNGGETKYQGEWNDDLFEGVGYLDCPEYCYDGEFLRGLKNGLGNILYKKSKIGYTGSFKNGLQHSYGVALFQQRNIRYEGEFENGIKKGHGIMTFEDGSYYEGRFEDSFFGLGVFVTSDGQRYSGNWIGECLKCPDGKEYFLDSSNHGCSIIELHG